MIAVWLLLQIILVVAAVQLVDRNRWRRLASIVLLVAALIFPLFVPSPALLRAVLACLGLLAVVKVVQIAPAPELWPPRYRLWHGLVPFDLADTQRVTPSLDRKLLLSIALHAGLALLALSGLILLPRSLSVGLMLVRLMLGTWLVYTAMDAITGAIRLAHLLAGVAVPPIQQTPILSQSVREFWSRRWNLPVSGWLDTFVFRPVAARQGSTLALVAAFGVSALLHAWMFFTAAGLTIAILAAVFFLLQALFVLVESAIGIRFLVPSLRRSWTLGMLLISSPLFVEPVLRVLGL